MDRLQRRRVKLKSRRIKWRADREFDPGFAGINVHRHGRTAAVSGYRASLGWNFAECHELGGLEFFRFEYCQRERSRRGHGLGVGHCDHHSPIKLKNIERRPDGYGGGLKPDVNYGIGGSIFDTGQYDPAIYSYRIL